MRIFKWVVIAIFSVLALAIGSLWIAAASNLDRSYRHTATTTGLPLFMARSTGLVRIPGNGFEFRARVAGFDNPAPLGDLLLLHGFPETSIMYEPLIDAASQAGYRVVAPDQRGYSPGARPAGRSAYHSAQLMTDALALRQRAKHWPMRWALTDFIWLGTTGGPPSVGNSRLIHQSVC